MEVQVFGVVRSDQDGNFRRRTIRSEIHASTVE